MSLHPNTPSWGDPRELAARLTQRVTFQEAVDTPDEAGGSTRNWQDLMTRWAEVMPQRGTERLIDGRVQADATHRIVTRFDSNITTALRIIYAGRVFNIRSVTNVAEKNVLMEIAAEEGVAS